MPPRSAAAPTPQIAPRGSATLSVARLPQILDLLSRASPHGASLASLSAQTGIPKSSLLNILRGLQSLGYLTSVNNIYHLGSEAYALANLIISTLRSGRLPAIARSTLQRLSGHGERNGDPGRDVAGRAPGRLCRCDREPSRGARVGHHRQPQPALRQHRRAG
jgi:hypothetical protein